MAAEEFEHVAVVVDDVARMQIQLLSMHHADASLLEEEEVDSYSHLNLHSMPFLDRNFFELIVVSKSFCFVFIDFGLIIL